MAGLELVPALHLLVGTLTVLCGFGALAARKGALPHRLAGLIFLVSMLLLAASGAYMSIARSILFTLFLAMFSIYLVLTGWFALRWQNAQARLVERLGLFFSAASFIGLMTLGFAESHFGISTGGDVPQGANRVLAGVAAIFTIADLNAVIRGNLSRNHQIARHLWRMCASMLIATTIFFLGNSTVLPEFLRYDVLLATPVVLVLLAMIFWLAKTLMPRISRSPVESGEQS